MNLYFAVSNNRDLKAFQPDRKYNFLWSFEYHTPTSNLDYLGRLMKNRLIIDSGAFSVWKKGGQVDIKEYASHCIAMNERFQGRVICVNLDVIPGRFGVKPTKLQAEDACRQSFENFKLLKAMTCCEIMPVFHQHDGWDWLDRYLQHGGFDVLGVSPANDETNEGRRPFLDQTFATVKVSKKCHGLAATGQDILQRYPWYSCDSASFKLGAAWGNTLVFKDGKFFSAHYRKSRDRFLEIFDKNLTGKNHYARVVFAINSFLALEKHVTSIWAKRGIVWE